MHYYHCLVFEMHVLQNCIFLDADSESFLLFSEANLFKFRLVNLQQYFECQEIFKTFAVI